MFCIPRHSAEENIAVLRSIFELLASKRSNIFQIRSLARRIDGVTGQVCNKYMKHFVDAGLVEVYNFSIHRRSDGSAFKRNILYRRLFDDSVDIDKGMEVMIRNDVHRKQGDRVPHLQ